MWKLQLLPLAAATAALSLSPLHADARPGVQGGARTSVQGSRPAARPAPAAQVNRGAAANRSATVNRSATTNVNRGGNRVNTGNVNVGNNVNVNVDHDNGWGWDDNDHHPIAAGVAFGTAAAVTSAALGARYNTLPPACAPYPYSGLTYYSCGGVYYAPQYEGDNVVYVVVERPG